MSGEDFTLKALAETTKKYVKTVEAEPGCSRTLDDGKKQKMEVKKSESNAKKPLLRRLPSLRSTLRPSFYKLRNQIQRVSCFKGEEDEEVPMMEVPRHRSIDIGVGLARRMSLFIFTKRSVCVHPYHPYVPKQTTRKIYFSHDD